MYDNMTKEDFQNVAITTGATTQPFATNVDNVYALMFCFHLVFHHVYFVILPFLQVCG